MEIEYTGRHCDVSPDLRALAQQKLRKLIKMLHNVTDVHVIFTADKDRMHVEVSVHSRNLALTASEEGDDAAGTLAVVITKLTRQAQRHIGKLQERKRKAPARATALWSGVISPELVAAERTNGERTEAPPLPKGPRVIRTQRFIVKTMTADAAVREMDNEDFVVYRDVATERISVMYRRKDGNVGLIEPEA